MATKQDISDFVHRIAQHIWDNGQVLGNHYVYGDNKSKNGAFIPPWRQAKVKLSDGSNAVLNLVDYDIDIGKTRLEILISHGSRPYGFSARLFVREEMMSMGEDFPTHKVSVGDIEYFHLITESGEERVRNPSILGGIIEEVYKKLFDESGLVGT